MKASLLLLILVSSSLAADCTWSPRQSTQFRTTALDLSVDGPFVWLATGYGVQLLEGTRGVDSLASPGLTRVVQADNLGLAYAGSGARIHVVRRDGRKLTLIRSVDAPGTVQDLALEGGYLFAATTNGIAHYDLLDRTNPVRTNVVLHTSAPSVTMLASTRTTLYAADGDATVELFSLAIPALPQNVGTLEAMPLATSVHTASDNHLYVSDRFGQLTDVFSGTARVARLPFGATSFAAAADRVHYIAGPDRTIRAIDFTAPERLIERFEAQLAPTGGTDNAIHALARSGDMLYVAAGDVGLTTIDLRTIARPYPLVSYGTGATASVRVAGDRAWFGDANGNITEQRIDATGISLTTERTLQAGAGQTLRDVRDNTLLATNGATATPWPLTGTPVASPSVTFPDVIANAVLGNTSVIALLVNGSLYSGGTKIAVPPLALLARHGSSIVAAEFRENDGDTVLHYWANGDLATPARTITIDGAAVGNIALDATRAAIFTFNGINVVDLASGSVRTIAGSNQSIPRQLAFSGDDLLALDERSVLVYANAQTLAREQRLPAVSVAFDTAGAIAVIATNEGMAAVSRTTTLPQAATPFANDYYTKVLAAGEHVYLYSEAGVDIFHPAPFRRITGVRAPGAIDAAATATTLYTLAANGTVSAWSTSGVLLAQVTLQEPTGETQPLSIHTAGGAVWVSLSTGCTTGTCVRKTVVLDPATLLFATAMDGGVRDLAVSGNRAYVLVDAPNDIRVLDLTSPLQPAQLMATPRPASATSIAYETGRVHVLGDKLYTYSAAGLGLQNERFTAITPDDSQRIRIDGTCAIITGRSENPELYALPPFLPSTTFDVPSPVRSIAVTEGRAYLLTAHSLEVWSTHPLPQPGKRRSVR
ncbi:MAG TPA: hypothetical protein VE974_16820 [Thermoanaerobaculia bacterium]|nr:hypothetical protein [Thermoanaerobaculia bacterium]